MELVVSRRDVEKKLQAKRLRRVGRIPAVLYAPGKETQSIDIDAGEFKKMLMRQPSGTLSTRVFTLKEGKRKIQAILKEIQYQVTTYEPIHLDFEELSPTVAIELNVPIQMTGVAECIGVKLGGVLKQIMRVLRVRCLPDAIPTCFEIDVRDLNMGQAKRFSDIVLPAGVESLEDPKQVVAVIGKK